MSMRNSPILTWKGRAHIVRHELNNLVRNFKLIFAGSVKRTVAPTASLKQQVSRWTWEGHSGKNTRYIKPGARMNCETGVRVQSQKPYSTP